MRFLKFIYYRTHLDFLAETSIRYPLKHVSVYHFQLPEKQNSQNEIFYSIFLAYQSLFKKSMKKLFK